MPTANIVCNDEQLYSFCCNYDEVGNGTTTKTMSRVPIYDVQPEMKVSGRVLHSITNTFMDDLSSANNGNV